MKDKKGTKVRCFACGGEADATCEGSHSTVSVCATCSVRHLPALVVAAFAARLREAGDLEEDCSGMLWRALSIACSNRAEAVESAG